MTESLRLAAFGFKVDLVTAEVTAALHADSIPSILLKGPGIANWLYARAEPRLYVDSDLLLRRRDWDRALALVEELGFEDDLGPMDHPRMESGAGYPWTRPTDGAGVDLHYTLFGIGAEPEALWDAFAADAVNERVGGGDVLLPSRPARLLHIPLHAVQHGGDAWEKPMKDLELAVAEVAAETWREARRLADRLDASETFAAGLRLTAEGRELADAIGAPSTHPANATLRLDGTPMAEGFQELAETPALRRKLVLVARELFPSRAFMRWWTPLARRGSLGLALAYPWRLIWLSCRTVPGYVAWRRAARRQRKRSPGSQPITASSTPGRAPAAHRRGNERNVFRTSVDDAER